MKIIGIDFGTKRVGLAISDETQTFARELTIVPPQEVFKAIAALCDEEEVEGFALGYPLSMGGTVTQKTEEVLKFKENLEKQFNLPVELVDERLSSVMAGNLPGGSEHVDSLAAQIILQTYLDKNKH